MGGRAAALHGPPGTQDPPVSFALRLRDAALRPRALAVVEAEHSCALAARPLRRLYMATQTPACRRGTVCSVCHLPRSPRRRRRYQRSPRPRPAMMWAWGPRSPPPRRRCSRERARRWERSSSNGLGRAGRDFRDLESVRDREASYGEPKSGGVLSATLGCAWTPVSRSWRTRPHRPGRKSCRPCLLRSADPRLRRSTWQSA